MNNELNTLTSRREFFFAYDIKMGNPNGDPDENRPRVLPDGTHYVTDVRLKRFIRDFFKLQNRDILVDNIEGRTTNLTGRVVHYLKTHELKKAEGNELVEILLNAFIDARLFGSSFAFKAEKLDDKNKWEPKPEPKTLTGAVQISMGEVLHKAEEIDIHGTSIFASGEEKTQGTFTSFFGLRYALIGFSGIANQHSARISHLTDKDYNDMLKAMWFGVRSAGNTRTKSGQIPRLLINIEYNPGEEFQIGRLQDYVKLKTTAGKQEKEWSSPSDFLVDLEPLFKILEPVQRMIKEINYDVSQDITFAQAVPNNWKRINIEG